MERLQSAESYVQSCFERYLPKGFYYHNWEHTQGVVRLCEQLAQHQSTEQLETLLLAAWFHDLGYLSSLEAHEAHSITWWRAYAAPLSFSSNQIREVGRCIGATKLGTAAANELAAQLADADLAYSVADAAFETRGTALRKEWAALFNRTYSDAAWDKLQADFLQQAAFQSTQGKHYFQPELEKLRLRFPIT